VQVRVTGGPDPSGHNYAWTVENEDTSPIVRVEFPHIHADLFFVPEGWSQECTGLVNVGYDGKPGSCIAISDPGAEGIPRGAAIEFRMRIAPIRTLQGVGTVGVWLADGRAGTIPGVAQPVPETVSDKYLSLIALGLMFAVFVAVQTFRRSKARGSPAAAPTPEADGSVTGTPPS